MGQGDSWWLWRGAALIALLWGPDILNVWVLLVDLVWGMVGLEANGGLVRGGVKSIIAVNPKLNTLWWLLVIL